MQNIKYNNKDYTFFNTGEHYFTEKISYPVKQYDGYTVVSIFCDEVSYINTKPVILDASSMNIKYNRPGNVFIPMDENEEYYDKGTQKIILSEHAMSIMGKINEERFFNNYSFFKRYNNTEYENYDLYINTIPVVIPKENLKPARCYYIGAIDFYDNMVKKHQENKDVVVSLSFYDLTQFSNYVAIEVYNEITEENKKKLIEKKLVRLIEVCPIKIGISLEENASLKLKRYLK